MLYHSLFLITPVCKCISSICLLMSISYLSYVNLYEYTVLSNLTIESIKTTLCICELLRHFSARGCVCTNRLFFCKLHRKHHTHSINYGEKSYFLRYYLGQLFDGSEKALLVGVRECVCVCVFVCLSVGARSWYYCSIQFLYRVDLKKFYRLRTGKEKEREREKKCVCVC